MSLRDEAVENLARDDQMSRDDADAYALRSQQRASVWVRCSSGTGVVGVAVGGVGVWMRVGGWGRASWGF